MRVIKYFPKYTVNDYRRWEGDWELIDDPAYAMRPSSIRKHQSLSRRLIIQINESLKKQESQYGDCEVFYELDWIVDNNTIVRPDIAVVCMQTGDFITAPPVLIIEILSPSTALKDRQIKYEIYKKHGVKHYLVADPNAKTYNVFALVNGEYQEQKNTMYFPIHNQCNIHINVAQALADFE